MVYAFVLTDLKHYCLTSRCPPLYFHLTNNSILWKCKRLYGTTSHPNSWCFISI